MGSYKLSLIRDGILIGRIARDYADDLDALDFAYDLCRNHAIEVYDGDRLVARVKQGSERETVDGLTVLKPGALFDSRNPAPAGRKRTG